MCDAKQTLKSIMLLLHDARRMCFGVFQVMVFCEICHNVRKSFNLHQLAQVVSFLACTIADRSQVYNHQSTCVRLSLNLVECIYQVRLAGVATTVSGYSTRTWLVLCHAVSTHGWVCS